MSVQNQHPANFFRFTLFRFLSLNNSLVCNLLCITTLTVELINAGAFISSRAVALTICNPCHKIMQACFVCPVLHLATARCLLELSGLHCCLFVKVVCCCSFEPQRDYVITCVSSCQQLFLIFFAAVARWNFIILSVSPLVNTFFTNSNVKRSNNHLCLH